jgi:hypothetical protein
VADLRSGWWRSMQGSEKVFEGRVLVMMWMVGRKSKEMVAGIHAMRGAIVVDVIHCVVPMHEDGAIEAYEALEQAQHHAAVLEEVLHSRQQQHARVGERL